MWIFALIFLIVAIKLEPVIMDYRYKKFKEEKERSSSQHDSY